MTTSTVLATCTEIIPTGKRHNSFYFDFKIMKVLDGKFSDTSFKSKEFFEFDAAQRIMEKLKISKVGYNYVPGETQVILRLITRDNHFDLLWISEMERMADLEKLEMLIISLREAIKNNQYEKIESHLKNNTDFKEDDLIAVQQFLLKNPDDMLFLREILREKTGGSLLLYVCSETNCYTFCVSQNDVSGNWEISKISKVPKYLE